VYALAPFATRGLAKMSGTVLPVVPGGEARVLDQLSDGTGEDPVLSAAGEALRTPGAVVLVGERAATSEGALSSVVRLARASGASLGWVPRRAGDRAALEAGALPTLLPGGRPVTDGTARAEVAAVWGVDQDALPATPGRSTADMISAASAGRLGALLIGAVEVDDLANPAAALAAIDRVPFVVSLELRRSAVTEHADVVFPIAATAEKDGTFVDWEGRERPFLAALRTVGIPPDGRVLTAIADEMDVALGLVDADAARAELHRLGVWTGVRAVEPLVSAGSPALAGAGEAILASWRMLLDAGRAQDGEENLAGTARAPRVRLGKTIAAQIGAAEGDPVTVSTDRGRITLPLEITEMPDRVVWLPMNSPGSAVPRELGVGPGAVVRVGAGGAE